MALTIQDYKDMYNKATTKEQKDAAHAGAESIRASQGYSGGVDGSQNIKLPTQNSNTNKVKVDSSGKAKSGLGVGTVVETAGGNFVIKGVNKDGSYISEKETAPKPSLSKDLSIYNGRTMKFGTGVKKFEDMNQAERGIFLSSVGHGKDLQKEGVSYAYVDDYGFTHVVDNIGTATAYSKDGNVYEYTGANKGGYAIDEKGNRAYLNLPGSKMYGNVKKDAEGNVIESTIDGSGLNNIVNGVDGTNIGAQQPQTITDADNAKIAALKDAYNKATTQAEKDKIHAEANAIRAKYGIDGGVDGNGVKSSITESIISSTGIAPEALETPEISSMIDNIVELAMNKKEQTINTIAQNERDAIREQNKLATEANQNATENEKTLNTNEYQTLERNKIMSSQRGIMNSQQVAGLEQGIQGEYAGLRFKNEQDRDTRLQAIKDKVASIKEQADTLTMNAEIQANNDVLTAQIEEDKQNRDFEMKVALQEMQNAFTASENDEERALKVDMFNKAFEQDLIKMGIDQQNKKELMALDNQAKMALAQMDINARMKIASMNNATQKNVNAALALEAIKKNKANGFASDESVMTSMQNITTTIDKLVKNPKAVEQLKKAGTIDGISVLDIQTYNKATGKNLINDIKALIQTKELKNPQYENLGIGEKSIKKYYIDPTASTYLLKATDASYLKNKDSVNSWMTGMEFIQGMSQTGAITYDQAMDASQDPTGFMNAYLKQ